MSEKKINAERITDSALDEVIGGTGGNTGNQDRKEMFCKNCRKKTMFIIYSGGRGYCTECNKTQDV